MRKPEFYSAVFAIITDSSGKILFQKRQNTGFRDGKFQLPSGHIEGLETINNAIIRELKEELGIVVGEDAINIAHIAHTIAGNRPYYNMYTRINSYLGDIVNIETDKCSEIGFYDFEKIKDNLDFVYETETLEKIYAGKIFSEKIVL